jgi:hypothetical protein
MVHCLRHVASLTLALLPRQLRAQWDGVDQREVARRLVDLVVVSVLLDAGAGDAWKYSEESTGITIGRSEGLGVGGWVLGRQLTRGVIMARALLGGGMQVASFHMFAAGAFSSSADKPHQADSAALKALTPAAIRSGFQVVREAIL